MAQIHKFRVPVGTGQVKMVKVPSHAHGFVRNLLDRVGTTFRFKDEDQLKRFADKRMVPPELASLVPAGKDPWSFLTSPSPTPLPPPRKVTIPVYA